MFVFFSSSVAVSGAPIYYRLSQIMEDFSGLALPPLFGGHILEAELEPGGVELGPGEVIFVSFVFC